MKSIPFLMEAEVEEAFSVLNNTKNKSITGILLLISNNIIQYL
jgi:hypothetical protein